MILADIPSMFLSLLSSLLHICFMFCTRFSWFPFPLSVVFLNLDNTRFKFNFFPQIYKMKA